jgi:hypothetical protein
MFRPPPVLDVANGGGSGQCGIAPGQSPLESAHDSAVDKPVATDAEANELLAVAFLEPFIGDARTM